MVEEAFGGQRRIAATLTAATPLLLTGLAAAIAFRAGIFNVGAEGCFYLGGLVAAVVGYVMAGWPSMLLIPIALGAAAIVGGVWLIGPALARTSLGVDEVVTTLMLNFIAVDMTSWLVNGPLLARGSANSATLPIGAGAELPRLLAADDAASRVRHQSGAGGRCTASGSRFTAAGLRSQTGRPEPAFQPRRRNRRAAPRF